MAERSPRQIAEAYVAARECTAEMLRRVLMRRDLPSEVVEAEIARMLERGLIDDARYARMKALSGLASGRGARRLKVELARKGVAREVADEAIGAAMAEYAEARGGETEDAETLAAERFAERKKLGRWRSAPLPEDPAERAKLLRRELAAFARAGFGADISRRLAGKRGEDD